MPMLEETADDPAQQAALHGRYQTWNLWALIVVALALVVGVVLHEPRAWGDGELATLALHTSRATLVVAALVAYVTRARMAELRGFCLGRFRRSPKEIRGDEAGR